MQMGLSLEDRSSDPDGQAAWGLDAGQRVPAPERRGPSLPPPTARAGGKHDDLSATRRHGVRQTPHGLAWEVHRTSAPSPSSGIAAAHRGHQHSRARPEPEFDVTRDVEAVCAAMDALSGSEEPPGPSIARNQPSRDPDYDADAPGGPVEPAERRGDSAAGQTHRGPGATGVDPSATWGRARPSALVLEDEEACARRHATKDVGSDVAEDTGAASPGGGAEGQSPSGPASEGGGAGPGGRRSLHAKLSSPDRRRRSPSETLRRQQERHRAAEANKQRIEQTRAMRRQEAERRQTAVCGGPRGPSGGDKGCHAYPPNRSVRLCHRPRSGRSRSW